MDIVEILFWLFSGIVAYTYAGYPLILFLSTRFTSTESKESTELPSVTLIIAAYNEENWIEAKLQNSFDLDYPQDKLSIIVVTDGSTDRTVHIAENEPRVQHFHRPERRGKTDAINRILPEIKSEITVFTDANTLLNKSSIKVLVGQFNAADVGVVAGEKRIQQIDTSGASSSGEGLYWKYESKLKTWDSRLYSVIGAAGELFAVRTSLLFPVKKNVIIEDFYVSMKLAMNGWVTRYAPKAYAMETGSSSIEEEMKRKVRISAGGLQAIYLLSPLLNIFKYGVLSFQYISHRVLRWTLAPLGLIVILLTSSLLTGQGQEYALIFYAQLAFYAFAFVGWLIRNSSRQWKIFYVPFYFSLMNFSVFAGGIALLRRKELHIWDKANRANQYDIDRKNVE